MLSGNVVFSVVNGRKGCSVDAISGNIITTETALDTSRMTIRATFTSYDGEVVIHDDYSVEVKRLIYPMEISISGAVDPFVSQEYVWSTTTDNVNGEYTVEWLLNGDITSYVNIGSSDSRQCILALNGTPPDTVEGTLQVTIKRKFDNTQVATTTFNLNHVVE